jgi:hypothetical protein
MTRSSTGRPDQVARYARAVRAALSDVPAAEREAMLEDLHGHLAEVASEPGGSLDERLGPQERYAAELRAAYGARPTTGRPPPPGRAFTVRRVLVAAAVLGVLAWAAVVLPGLAAWARGSQSAGGRWTTSQLLDEARAGAVRSVEITGHEAVATGRDGAQHPVHLPDDTSRLAPVLAAAGVDVTYEQASPGSALLTVLLPNAMLLLLLAGPPLVALLLVGWLGRRRLGGQAGT